MQSDEKIDGRSIFSLCGGFSESPVATEPIGSARLILRYDLQPLPLARSAVIDTAVKGRRTARDEDDIERLCFEPKYRPESILAGDLQFALRYEGVTLEVLALLFAKAPRAEIEAWLAERPESAAARRAGYRRRSAARVRGAKPAGTGLLHRLVGHLTHDAYLRPRQ